MNQTEHPRFRKKQLIGIALYALAFFAIILISNIEEVGKWIATINTILSPIVTGVVIAYLANPFFRFFERRLLVHVRPYQLRRYLSLALTYLVLLLIVAGLLLLIVPQLISSIQTFSQNFRGNLENGLIGINAFIDSVNRLLPQNADGTAMIPTLNMELVQSAIISGWDALLKALMENLKPENLGVITNLISQTGVIIANTIIGVFISIYLLVSKEKRYAQIMKFRRAYFGESLNARMTTVCDIADRSFGGFLRGKLLDSTLVGLLVYITCLIFNIPYAVLVAVIIGITDIVPVIGPFIGVIPTAIIILLTDPIKVIIFLVAILVIQQIDGNIIAPKILGENTGVSSLCVMIAILVMGDLLGLLGMIIGVPLFATVIELWKIFLNNRLRAKGLPVESDDYAQEKPIVLPQQEEIPIQAEPQPVPVLSKPQQSQLRAYALAKKHGLFSELSEEALNAFAAEYAAVEAEPISHTTLEAPSATETGAATAACINSANETEEAVSEEAPPTKADPVKGGAEE